MPACGVETPMYCYEVRLTPRPSLLRSPAAYLIDMLPFASVRILDSSCGNPDQTFHR
jgi:hypothetical protein